MNDTHPKEDIEDELRRVYDLDDDIYSRYDEAFPWTWKARHSRGLSTLQGDKFTAYQKHMNACYMRKRILEAKLFERDRAKN